MKIEEMRAGISHLRNRMETSKPANIFEMRSLREPDLLPALAEAAAAEAAAAEASEAEDLVEAWTTTEPAVVPASELDGNIWSVVSFAKVGAGSLTYAAADAAMADLAARGVNGLCIVTDEAAARMK
jgi:hypothetical protein